MLAVVAAAGMRAVTHKAQNNKYLFSLIKKKKRLGLRINPPQALTCCTAVTAVVEKFFEAWDGCAAARQSFAPLAR